jgi:hypothetical protein
MSRPKQSTLIIPPDDDPGGNTPFERFDNIMKRILSTPKKEANEKAAEWKRKREKRNPNRA